jgi:hypothetical protein
LQCTDVRTTRLQAAWRGVAYRSCYCSLRCTQRLVLRTVCDGCACIRQAGLKPLRRAARRATRSYAGLALHGTARSGHSVYLPRRGAALRGAAIYTTGVLPERGACVHRLAHQLLHYRGTSDPPVLLLWSLLERQPLVVVTRHIEVHAPTHVTNARTRARTHTRAHTCARTHTYAHTHAHTATRTRTHKTRTHTLAHTATRTRTHKTRTHTLAHIIHTRANTHAQNDANFRPPGRARVGLVTLVLSATVER